MKRGLIFGAVLCLSASAAEFTISIPSNSPSFGLTNGAFRFTYTRDKAVFPPSPEDGGGIIPADRRVDWSLSGIPGGIPNRITVFRTLPSGATLSDVQSAINACPVNQVVALSAGIYFLDGNLDFSSVKDGVVLRGAGAGQTAITFSAGSILMRHVFSEATLSVDAPLSVGAPKGATTITLASVPAWVLPGHIYLLDQLNDARLAQSDGQEKALIYRRSLGNGDRGIGQTIKVTSKTATNVGFEVPLYIDFPLVNQPQIAQSGYNPVANSPLRNCGIENLSITSSYANGGAHAIVMENCDGCWIKGVTSTNGPGGCHVWTVFSYRCEIRDSVFAGSHLYGSGQGYGVALYHATCGFRVENNVFSKLHVSMQVNYGSSGNVFGYNSAIEGQSDAKQSPGINSHGCHAFMNLFEGNFVEGKVLGDFTHGSSSHNTLFRNGIIGYLSGEAKDQVVVSLERYNRHWNLVGNVFGKVGWHDVYEASPWTVPASDETRPIYKLGYWSNFGGEAKETDSESVVDLLRYGNWNTVTGMDTYTATRPIPASLYLPSKPEWIQGPWPVFDSLKP